MVSNARIALYKRGECESMKPAWLEMVESNPLLFEV